MILETPRLYLRHFKEEDAPRFSEYRDKKEVAKYQTWNRYSLNDAKRRIAHCLRNPNIQERGNYQFAVVLKENNMLIGDLFVETNRKRSFILGYTLDSSYWDKGLATEIVTAFLEYMKLNYPYTKAICYVYSENKRSKHLLKKLGFEKFHESYFYDDEGYVKIL